VSAYVPFLIIILYNTFYHSPVNLFNPNSSHFEALSAVSIVASSRQVATSWNLSTYHIPIAIV